MELRSGKVVGPTAPTVPPQVFALSYDGQSTYYSLQSFREWLMLGLEASIRKAYAEHTDDVRNHVLGLEMAKMMRTCIDTGIYRESIYPEFMENAMCLNRTIASSFGLPKAINWNRPVEALLKNISEYRRMFYGRAGSWGTHGRRFP